MANLRVDKITSTETFETTGSVQFDATGDVLTVPNSADFRLGNGDFTIECWFYYKGPLSSNRTLFGLFENSSARRSYQVEVRSDGVIRFEWWPDGSTGNSIDTAASTVSSSTWYHYAATRTNGIITQYLNGESVVSSLVGTSSFYDNTDDPFRIGALNANVDQSFLGHISNVRIIKGKALYTKNFKVPMKELEATPETVLLCCQSKTSAAAAKVSPNISGVNDGTIWSDALDVTNGGRLRHQDFGDGQTYSPSLIFDGDTSTDAEGPNGTNNSIIYDFENLLGKSIPVSSSIKIVIGGSDGRTLKVNGTTIGTNLGSAVQTITNQSALNKIEVVAESSSRSGRLADIKVDDVSLLLPVLPFGRNIHASELSPGLLTDKVVDGGSSAIKGSVEFDGEYDGLVLSKSTDFQFGTGDFTIEGWFNVSDTGAIRTLFDSRNSDTVTDGLFIGINSNDNLYTYGFPRGTGTVNYGIPKHGEWHHFAVVRNGSNGYVFLNGVKVSGSIDTSSSNYIHQGATVGQPSTAFAATLYRYKGFISNLRVNKGTALYTADFIPPTRELKKVPGTVLLCCQDPDNPLTEATGKTITGYGDLQRADDVELITNGNFSSTDNWTAVGNASLSTSSGQIVLTGDGSTAGGGAAQGFATIVGKKYVLKYEAFSGTISAGQIRIGTSANSFSITFDNSVSASAHDDITFIATSTTTYVTLGLNAGVVTSGTFKYDNVSVTLVDGSNKGSNFTPQVGDNRKVTLEGVTKINSDAYFYLPTGNTESRYLNVASQASSAARGLRSGGQTPSVTDTIDFTTIPTRGNSLDFGNLTVARFGAGGIGSPTRGLFCGGGTPTRQSAIDYITIASEGDAQDFGDLFDSARTIAGSSGGNSVRGLTFGGATAASTVNTICYVTIASTGNGQDFGDCTKQNGCAVVCSPTRAVSAGGDSAANGSHINTIDFVTIQTMGFATDFGDLLSAGTGRGVSSATRGVFSTEAPSAAQTLTFLTMATEGNVIDFGDLISNNLSGGCAAYSSLTRGIFAGIRTPTVTNVCEFITIASTGNATDFGDLITIATNGGGLSNGHGGLG
jgi:hypothetical protein